MAENRPIIQRICNQLESYDGSEAGFPPVTSIGIRSESAHYQITAQARAIGQPSRDIMIDVRAPAGIFGDELPARVTVRGITPGGPLGGDNMLDHEGSELYTELHRQLGNLREPLRHAFETARVTLVPETLGYQETRNLEVLQGNAGTVALHQTVSYQVTSAYESTATAHLTTTLHLPYGHVPAPHWAHDSGVIEHEDKVSRLSPPALIAFTQVHNAIEDLYLDNPYGVSQALPPIG